jgi:glutamine synthetase
VAQSLRDRLDAENTRQLWVVYHDYSGLSHAKTVPPERFDDAIGHGIAFARANMDFNILDHQVPDVQFGADTGDFFAVPDPSSYAPLPHHPGAARVFSFLRNADGSPWAGCPRAATQRVVERFVARGLHVSAAFEPECYLFTRDGAGWAPADQSRMFTVEGMERHAGLIERLMDDLPRMDVTLEQIGAEYGPGQYEVNMRYAGPVKAADDLNTVKDVMRVAARDAGLLASFMPKPFSDLPGCGLHVHLGLQDDNGGNVMAGDGPSGLSELGRWFVAGLLAHAPALAGLGAPTVNSYKRLQPGSWSPAHVCWGAGNRAALVRVPDGGATHVEYRSGDNTSNPHLYLTGLLAAGLDGIERVLDPGDPVRGDVGHLSAGETAALGLRFLPRTASDALDALERDEVVVGALGPVIGPTFLRVKRSEIAAYDLTVGDWERTAYLETV